MLYRNERAMVSRGLKVLFMVTIFMVTTFLVGGATTTKLPGQSLADYILQRDAGRVVMILDGAIDDTCKQREIVNTEIIEYPENPSKDPWTERWTVDRCGELVYYKVVFTPSSSGGTTFFVSVWK